MVAYDKQSHIIGLWRGSERAVQVCPLCPRVGPEYSMDEFKAMFKKASFEDYRPICPLCHQTGFIYLEHPGEREWFDKGLQKSFRFVGWEHPAFIQKIASLYGTDSVALRNIKDLAQNGF